LTPSSAPENLKEEDVSELMAYDRELRVSLAKIYAKEKNILAWGKMLFPHKFPLPFCNDLHQYLVDIRKDTFTNTEAPRNHAKTTLQCFLIPIFQALEEPKEYLHYLNVQATAVKALAVNTAIRHEIETNEEVREIYGDQVGPDRWSDGQFVLSNGVIFTAISAGQSIRGINLNNVRPDYLIVDDLYDATDINNPESTENKNAWFWGDLHPARAQSRQNAIHIQGTAINREDLLEKLKSAKGVKSRTFRAILDWDKKIVLWPELKSFDAWMTEKEDLQIPSTIWFREYQNERRDDATSIIKESWLRNQNYTWEYDPTTLKFDNHFILQAVRLGVDPSIGEKVENDFTGIALVMKTSYHDSKDAEYYIQGLWEEKKSLDQRVLLLQGIQEALPLKQKVTEARVEAIAGFKDFASEVRRRTNLPVKEIDKVKDKITNLELKSKYFENRKVHLNKNIEARLKEKLIYQLTNNHPNHDDIRDGVFLCLDDKSGLWNFI
jgi:hypothetical protein